MKTFGTIALTAVLMVAFGACNKGKPAQPAPSHNERFMELCSSTCKETGVLRVLPDDLVCECQPRK